MAKRKPNPKAAERKAAQDRGEPRYFTGRPCEYGHIAQRWTGTGYCIECSRERGRRWHAENPEKAALKAKKAYAANPERAKKNRKEWYSKPENKEKAKVTREKYKLKNGEAMAAYSRQNAASYRQRFPEKAKQAIDNWWAKNPGRKKTYARNRRAMKRGNGGAHTQADIEAILKAQKGRCAYCRRPVPKEGNERHVDHIVPLIKGGTNDRRNLQILCQPCNLEKGRRDPLDHARTLGLLL